MRRDTWYELWLQRCGEWVPPQTHRLSTIIDNWGLSAKAVRLRIAYLMDVCASGSGWKRAHKEGDNDALC